MFLVLEMGVLLNSNGHMAADEWKNEEACMSKLKERTEELKKQRVKERGKVDKLLVIEEDGKNEKC